MSYNKFIPDEVSMLAFGAVLASVSVPKTIIFLQGQLGAGKTTLVRGFLRGLGFFGQVKSPTYTLVEPYEFADFSLFHFDFYRISDPRELEFMGIQDYFGPQSICLIEWPEHVKAALPAADLSCDIEWQQQGRTVKIIADSPLGQSMLEKLQ